jgi:hypothetical protein
MPDERLSTWPLGQDASVRGGTVRGLLSALWSFLQHPAVTVQETVAGAEHRLEEDFQRAIRGRVAGVQARLETVRSRVVEDLKSELRQVVLTLGLVMGCGLLALVGMTFGLMAAWTELKGFVGAVGASLVLAVLFLLASLVMFGLLRSVLHRSHPPPGASKTAT